VVGGVPTRILNLSKYLAGAKRKLTGREMTFPLNNRPLVVSYCISLMVSSETVELTTNIPEGNFGSMNGEAEDFRKYIGGWMISVSNTVSQSLTKDLSASGVTMAEWVLLRLMIEREDSIAPSEIADRTGMTRGAVTKLVDRSIEKKLAIRSESKKDRRFQEIRLTKKAKNLVPKLVQLTEENDKRFFSCLTKGERTTLTNLLKKVSSQNAVHQIALE